MTSNRAPSRVATLDDVVGALEQIGYTLADLLEVTRAAAQAAEVPLYCPPSQHCLGGVRLMRHAEAYWRHDGKDADRLYHPLPEGAYYRYEGEGPFHGSEVRNHSVWRSKALTGDAVAAMGLQVADDSEPEDEAPESPRTAPQPERSHEPDHLETCPDDGATLMRGRNGWGHVVHDKQGRPVGAHAVRADGTVDAVPLGGRGR